MNRNIIERTWVLNNLFTISTNHIHQFLDQLQFLITIYKTEKQSTKDSFDDSLRSKQWMDCQTNVVVVKTLHSQSLIRIILPLCDRCPWLLAFYVNRKRDKRIIQSFILIKTSDSNTLTAHLQSLFVRKLQRYGFSSGWLQDIFMRINAKKKTFIILW